METIAAGITWATMWQALAVLVPVAGMLLLSHLRLDSRIQRIETKLQMENDQADDIKIADKNARALELINHCAASREACPAYREHQRWAGTSQVQRQDPTNH